MATPVLILGTAGADNLNSLSGNGTDYKYDAKNGDDVVKGSTGDDLFIGGGGSDYLFGGLGADTFQFGKDAFAGDHDYIDDFKLELGDLLKFGGGVTITKADAAFLAIQSMNGQSLHNDSKVYDLTLTLHVEDAGKSFDYQVTLMDVIKNKTFSADAFEDYLGTFGYTGGITFGDVPA